MPGRRTGTLLDPPRGNLAPRCRRWNRVPLSSPGPRPENGLRPRPDASAPTPLRSRRAARNPGPDVTIHPEDHAMLGHHPFSRQAVRLGIAVGSLAAAACGENTISGPTLDVNLSRVAGFEPLKAALVQARKEANGGFNLDMWAAVVDRSGLVVAVVFTGATATDQWPGSRVIAAQKANTANAFSLPHLALSTAILYAATQPGGTLFGLQEANPTNEDVAYGGDAADYGTPNDFMVGKRIGGTNVFGGGLPLYNADGILVGGLGVSGDASCADHNIAWKMRDNLNLDFVPAGVADGGKDDNIIYDIDVNGVSTSGFGHPKCSAEATTIGEGLPQTNPISH